jgi:hypothetical protein
MTARRATLGVALGLVLAAGRVSGEEPSPLPLRLTWLDVEGVAVGVDGVARSECRSVLEKAGLEVKWRRGAGGEEARPGEVRVLLVDHFVVEPNQHVSIMGATPAQPRLHPVVWIHVGSVRASLGFPPDFPIADLPLRLRRDIGVALGRVVAHEIVHVLAPRLPHGSGLMSPTLTPDMLILPHLWLKADDAAQVRAALHDGLAPTTVYESGVLAASATVETGGGGSR